MSKARTMRNIWDEERKAAEIQKEVGIVLIPEGFSSKKDLEGLAKQREYFLEHLKRKTMVMDFFPAYERYLGNAGFAKISSGQFNKN